MAEPGTNMDLASAINAAYAQRALQYATPATLPYVQRSAYLNDALQSMRRTGGQNLRTPMALGTNLLALALDQFAAGRANRQLLARTQGDQSNYEHSLATLGAGMGAFGQPPGGAAGASGDAAAGGASAAQPPAATQPQSFTTPPATGPAPIQQAPADPDVPARGSDRDLLARALVGEAGDSPDDEAAAMSVIHNRATMAGKPESAVLFEPHQFEAVDNPRTWSRLQALPQSAPAYQQALKAVDRVESQGPTGSWDHFYSPRAQSALGRGRPAWDDGTGQMVGGQDFLSLGYGGKPPLTTPAGPSAFAQSAAPGPVQSTAAPAQAPPTPRPVQISTGPEPSIPAQSAAGPVGASPFAVQGQNPAPSSPGAANSPPLQRGGGAPSFAPPTGLAATPAEMQMIRSYLSSPYPIMREQGERLMQEIITRHSTALPPDQPMWNSQTGQYMPQPGRGFTQMQGSSPSDAAQMGPDGRIYHEAIPGMQGPLPEGTALANGQVVKIQGAQPRPLTDPAERARWGIQPNDRNAYAVGPDGKIIKTADSPYGPQQIQSVHDNFWNSDETKKAQEGYSAFTGLSTALSNMAAKNNGVLDTAAVDSYLRGINPGMGARNTTVNMFLSHLGFSQEVQSFIQSHVKGEGYLTPETLQHMAQVTHDYALAHQQAALSRAQADAKMVAPYGYGASDLAETLPALGSVPNVRFGAAAAAAPAPSPGVPGWPKDLDPASHAGQLALGLIRQHGYRFVNGELTK